MNCGAPRVPPSGNATITNTSSATNSRLAASANISPRTPPAGTPIGNTPKGPITPGDLPRHPPHPNAKIPHPRLLKALPAHKTSPTTHSPLWPRRPSKTSHTAHSPYSALPALKNPSHSHSPPSKPAPPTPRSTRPAPLHRPAPKRKPSPVRLLPLRKLRNQPPNQRIHHFQLMPQVGSHLLPEGTDAASQYFPMRPSQKRPHPPMTTSTQPR